MATDAVSSPSRTGPDGRRSSALLVALVALAFAGTFVAVRVSAVGFDGFVAAGSVTAEDASIFTYDHYGYDGQFFYRLALEPFSVAERVDGIAFDASAYRQQRIGYPLLAYITEALTPASTVQALVFVNLAAIAVMVFFGARIAQQLRRSPAWAVLLLAWPAFIFSLGLDLSEIVAAALVLGVVRFALVGQHSAATALACGAVLTRETTALLALAALVAYRRKIYAAPLALLAVWQVVIWARWHEIPGLTSLPAPGDRLLGLPLVGLVDGAQRWGIIDIAVFVALIVLAWLGLRHYQPGSLAGTAFTGYGLLALLIGAPVWESWRGFSRASVEFVLMVFVLRLHQPRNSAPSSSQPALKR